MGIVNDSHDGSETHCALIQCLDEVGKDHDK